MTEVESSLGQIEAAKQGVINLAAEVIVAQRLIDPAAFRAEEMTPHEELAEVLGLTAEVAVLPSWFVAQYLLNEAHQAAEALRSISGVTAVLGTGHPFYAIDQRGEPIEVAEIRDFLQATRDKVEADARHNHGSWPCTSCEAHNPLPDLKELCKPCDLTVFKPRDLFRALLDLDVFIVVDDVNADIEAKLEQKMRELGYQQSDISIAEGIRRSKEVLTALSNEVVPTEKLPIDIHVVSREEFEAGMKRIREGEQKVLIHERALRMEWVGGVMNLSFDLTFSLTEIGVYDEDFRGQLRQTRRVIAERYAGRPQDILEDLSKHSERAGRLVNLKPVADALLARIKQWGEEYVQ